MFRLIIALGVAAVLFPAETVSQSKKQEITEVSTYDTFSAAHSLYADVSTFCERNEETCITGKALAANALHTIKDTISQITENSDSSGSLDNIDLIKTSSTKK